MPNAIAVTTTAQMIELHCNCHCLSIQYSNFKRNVFQLSKLVQWLLISWRSDTVLGFHNILVFLDDANLIYWFAFTEQVYNYQLFIESSNDFNYSWKSMLLNLLLSTEKIHLESIFVSKFSLHYKPSKLLLLLWKHQLEIKSLCCLPSMTRCSIFIKIN